MLSIKLKVSDECLWALDEEQCWLWRLRGACSAGLQPHLVAANHLDWRTRGMSTARVSDSRGSQSPHGVFWSFSFISTFLASSKHNHVPLDIPATLCNRNVYFCAFSAGLQLRLVASHLE